MCFSSTVVASLPSMARALLATRLELVDVKSCKLESNFLKRGTWSKPRMICFAKCMRPFSDADLQSCAHGFDTSHISHPSFFLPYPHVTWPTILDFPTYILISWNRMNRMILVQHIYNLQAILKMATTSESRFYTSFTGNCPSFSHAFLLWNPFDLGKAGLLLVDFAAALTTKLTACTCSCCEAGQQSFLRGSSVVCTPLFTIAVPWRWWSPPFLLICFGDVFDIVWLLICVVPGSFGVRSLRFFEDSCFFSLDSPPNAGVFTTCFGAVPFSIRCVTWFFHTKRSDH